jgi:MoaA/NifB/PqqE/SkfB family radical SAM enzyme
VLLQEVACARGYGLGVHVITRVEPGTRAQIPELGRIFERAGVHVWTLSFPTERGAAMLRGVGLDEALAEIALLAPSLSLQLEVAGAPQVRRVLRQRSLSPDLVSVAPAEGHGLLHVSADGSLRPSPALAAVVGNARQEDVADAFRDAPVLCALRDPHRLAGKCRLCEYVMDCGGSRARAWSFTGDWLASDPACGYQPPGPAVAPVQGVQPRQPPAGTGEAAAPGPGAVQPVPVTPLGREA